MSGAAAQWGAFASPPPGSNLAIVAAELEKSAEAGALTAERLRPVIAAGLERQGAPRPPREAWLDQLIDEKAASVARAVAMMNNARPAAGPSTFAALVGLATFFRRFRARPEAPFEDICRHAAQELGPGVGAHEVEGLLRRHLARTRTMSDRERDLFVTAVSVVDGQCEELPLTNLSVTEAEFFAVFGVLDEMRHR